MKKKHIIIASVLLVLGLLTLIIVLSGSRTSTFKQDFHIEDIDAITKVFIADKQDNHVLLERVADTTCAEQWQVDGQYPASQPMVDLMLSTLHDMRIRQQVNRNAVPQVIKLLSARAVKVEVYQRQYFINWFKGKFRLFPHTQKTVYFIGHETQDMMACHMFREGDKVPYIIHIPGFRGYLTPRFRAESMSWRSHNIVRLNVRQIARVELELPNVPQESFAIIRQGEGFGMELLQNHVPVPAFDTARVAQMLSSFANLNFDEYAAVVPNADVESSMQDGPGAILRISDTAGNLKELKTYRKYNNPDDRKAMPDTTMYDVFDLNRLYAVIDNRDTVLIQYFIFDNILQPAHFFIGENR